MRKYLLIGGLLFALFVVAFAPAGLLRSLLEPVPGVALLNPTGTIWRGAGDLYLAEQPAGTVRWQFQPVTILQGSLGYHLHLTGPDHDLNAEVAASPSRLRMLGDGRLGSAFVNQWLGPYDIALGGDLRLNQVAIAVPFRSAQPADALSGDPSSDPSASGATPGLAPGEASGSASWSGGNVRYRLSGQAYAGDLPPLEASLGEGLEARVHLAEGQTPLIQAQLLNNGFVKIGITRLLTRLLNNPWPGSDADHEVVLEVEEQLY